MEDAISLAWAVREGDIDAYEAERRPIVESTQRAAQGSLEWFEGISRYTGQDPRTFAFNLLTRSRRITHGRAPDARPGLRGLGERRGADVHAAAPARPRAGQPGRRLPDGHVQLGGRDAGRLPPRAPRRAGDRRRRAGDDRDDLHERRRADHARLRRALHGRARRRVEADRRLRARALAARRSARSWATRGARARRSCCGRTRTGRSRPATGRWSRPRRCRICRGSRRCRAS